MTYVRDADETTDPEAAGGTDVTVGSDADGPVLVAQAEAEADFAALTHPVLTTVAGSYHGLITNAELAAKLQDAAGVRTRSNPSLWLGRVLAQAASLDVAEGRPALTALVVDKNDGTVGTAYDEVLRLTGAEPITDELAREKHAAAARMECYHWAGANIPNGGGNPALSPRYDMVVTRDRKKARQEAEPTVCPNCFMAIPPTGVCDNCG